MTLLRRNQISLLRRERNKTTFQFTRNIRTAVEFLKIIKHDLHNTPMNLCETTWFGVKGNGIQSGSKQVMKQFIRISVFTPHHNIISFKKRVCPPIPETKTRHWCSHLSIRQLKGNNPQFLIFEEIRNLSMFHRVEILATFSQRSAEEMQLSLRGALFMILMAFLLILTLSIIKFKAFICHGKQPLLPLTKVSKSATFARRQLRLVIVNFLGPCTFCRSQTFEEISCKATTVHNFYHF